MQSKNENHVLRLNDSRQAIHTRRFSCAVIRTWPTYSETLVCESGLDQVPRAPKLSGPHKTLRQFNIEFRVRAGKWQLQYLPKRRN